MICLICRQAEIFEGFTPIHFERGKMRLLIKHVPARVCQNCGEAYVDEETATQLLWIATKTSEAGELEEEIEYNNLV